MLAALQDLSRTTDILLKSLAASDDDKAHEAISVMLMQGMNYFGAHSPVMKQFFPVWDAIKSHIDRSDMPRALRQAQTWRTQLNEVMVIVQNQSKA